MRKFLSKFFKRSNDPWKNPNHEIWTNLFPKTKAGTNVSERSSIRYLTVFACVTLIAGDMARLPLILYRKTKSGKTREIDHPLYDLLHNRPNPETSSYHWREAGQGHACLWGNHYSVIDRHKMDGRIKSIWQIDNPGAVNVKRNDKGQICYKWRDENNKTHEKLKHDILHVPAFSCDVIYDN